MPDNMTVEQRSRTMSRIRSKDTRAEMTLRRHLHALGLRYRLHGQKLVGKPDIIFTKHRLLIFVDGDFWHGWQFHRWQHKLSPPWRQKIAGNRERDRQRNADLRKEGWRVVRIWEHEIERNIDRCIARINREIRTRRVSTLPRADQTMRLKRRAVNRVGVPGKNRKRPQPPRRPRAPGLAAKRRSRSGHR